MDSNRNAKAAICWFVKCEFTSTWDVARRQMTLAIQNTINDKHFISLVGTN